MSVGSAHRKNEVMTAALKQQPRQHDNVESTWILGSLG